MLTQLTNNVLLILMRIRETATYVKLYFQIKLCSCKNIMQKIFSIFRYDYQLTNIYVRLFHHLYSWLFQLKWVLKTFVLSREMYEVWEVLLSQHVRIGPFIKANAAEAISFRNPLHDIVLILVSSGVPFRFSNMWRRARWRHCSVSVSTMLRYDIWALWKRFRESLSLVALKISWYCSRWVASCYFTLNFKSQGHNRNYVRSVLDCNQLSQNTISNRDILERRHRMTS